MSFKFFTSQRNNNNGINERNNFQYYNFKFIQLNSKCCFFSLIIKENTTNGGNTKKCRRELEPEYKRAHTAAIGTGD